MAIMQDYDLFCAVRGMDSAGAEFAGSVDARIVYRVESLNTGEAFALLTFCALLPRLAPSGTNLDAGDRTRVEAVGRSGAHGLSLSDFASHYRVNDLLDVFRVRELPH